MNRKTNIEQLIVRYLDGKCNPDESKELLLWIESSSKNKKEFYELKDIWDASSKKEDNTGNAMLQFYRQQASKNNSKIKILRLWKTVAGIAAVLAIGFFSLFIMDMQKRETSDIQQPEPTMLSFKVPLGSRSEVELSDGTNVILNSGSELKYPGVFSTERREVTLTGEAFFKVKSDKTHPFIVKTDDFDVQVTGTQFNVCSYSDDNYSTVTLTEGQVGIQFEENNHVVDIVPGQQLFLNRDKRKYKVAESDVDIESAWKDGEFRFKEIDFPSLLKRLERWYDVKLSYSSPELETMSYNGNFRNQETIWQVLDALKLTTPIDYKRSGFRKFEIIYKPME